LDKIGNGNLATKSAQQMNVIRDTADAQYRTIDIIRDAAEIVVHLIAESRILQQWLTVLVREDEVQIDLGERLWHIVT
jgi:hypothetical protein